MPPQPPMPGQRYTYNPANGKGFGENASGHELTSEMKMLDLKPGTETAYHSAEADTNWPIISWVDDTGVDRQTTISPGVFMTDFDLITERESK